MTGEGDSYGVRGEVVDEIRFMDQCDLGAMLRYLQQEALHRGTAAAATLVEASDRPRHTVVNECCQRVAQDRDAIAIEDRGYAIGARRSFEVIVVAQDGEGRCAVRERT